MSAVAPLICFATTFTLLILFRSVSIFGAVAARCVENDQYWYTSTGGDWPLVSSFFLAFFLLFAWNILIAFDDWNRSKGTKVMIVVNTLAISISMYTFISLHDNAYFQYHNRNGYYQGIIFQPFEFPFPSRRTEDECVTYQRFSGRWRVVDREIGHYGFNVASLWIELHPWGKLHAADTTWQVPYEGGWYPPYQSRYADDKRWRDGYIYTDTFSAPWDFDLQGDVLILTSPPEYFREWERSRITLEREPSK